MLSWVFGQIDTFDFIVITAITVAVAYFLFFHKNSTTSKKPGPNYYSEGVQKVKPGLCTDVSPTIEKFRDEGRKVFILFGSQTGTAEELAERLSKDIHNYGQKAVVLDPEEVTPEDFEEIVSIPDVLLVLCMATYGEGEPTDNAVQFHEYLKDADIDLSGVRYAVFGLGNKTYEYFNAMGKFFDSRLEALGAKRICELGLGDDDGNMEEDFLRWRENFLPAVQNVFGWEAIEGAALQRQYRFEAVDPSTTRVFCGEIGKIGSYEKQRRPFNQRNPFLASVIVNRELHGAKSERSCRHIEISCGDGSLRYETGDHLGVYPTNDGELVEKLGKLLNVDLDLTFTLTNVDEESSKRNPFPCPCSYRTALSHYVDICSPVKSYALKAIAEYATNPEEKKLLLLLSSVTDAGLAEYSQFIQKEHRSIVDVLEYFPSCKPPLNHLLELLPRLQARYYSISSSPKVSPSKISLTVIITKYTIGDRLIKGVCTNYLHDKKEGDKIPVFVRRSTMRLPHNSTAPLIMIGPGTGFAPFRGFLQEKWWQKQQGREIGRVSVYYGCRHPEHDYIYKDELKEYVDGSVITDLNLAFSRYTEKKIYVQNKLWENRQEVWKSLENGGYIYVCGDARNMARDVQNTLQKIYMEVGSISAEDALSYQKGLEKRRRYQADVWS